VDKYTAFNSVELKFQHM